MEKKELLKVDDSMFLYKILTSKDYSYNLIKRIIHDLDTCYSADIHDENREKIADKIIKDKYTPTGKEFANQLINLLNESVKSSD